MTNKDGITLVLNKKKIIRSGYIWGKRLDHFNTILMKT
jgi:hypothetical protein